MEIISIKNDNVLLLYHPAEVAAEVGQQLSILESPERTEGLVVQVISNDSLEYVGLQQEIIQRILEERVSVQRAMDRETGMGEIKSLKVATSKIRKRIKNKLWISWDGWIPTRHVEILRLDGQALLQNVMPSPLFPLQSFCNFDGTAIQIDGPRMNMVSVVAGVKGSGKSHLAKHIALALSTSNIPSVIFDLNGEYIGLPNAQVLKWGQNFLPRLSDVGHEMLETLVRALYPLQPNSPSEGVFENNLRRFFNARRQYCLKNKQPFTIDIPFLQTQNWGGGDFVIQAINNRLDMLNNMKLFATTADTENPSLSQLYENACNGKPIVFDMRDLGLNLQRALVRSINQALEAICELETTNATARYPFVFFEEAHFYISEDAIVNIITRGRHIGMASIFITNTPQKLPDTVFRQLDNLFLLSLTHKDDIRNVSKNSFTDEETIQSFATRMPDKHALIIGNVTERYPLVVRIDPLPDTMPTTGKTRSTWDRFITE